MDNIIHITSRTDIVEHDAHAVAYTIAENEQFFYTLLCKSAQSISTSLSFILDRNAALNLEFVGLYASADIKIECVLRGESSSVSINGAHRLHQDNKVNISTVQHHQAAHTKSSLVIKSIVDDKAHLAYSGMIRVDKAARCSFSSQENKNILLSDAARVISVPSLEVLTHDVHCFHASALSKFDQGHLFYGASRGIDEKRMQSLLVSAFFDGMFKSEDALKELQRLL